MNELGSLRQRIDEIDRSISDLFLERMDIASRVASYKKASGTPIFDKTRERDNISRASKRVPPELASYAAMIEQVLMEASREAQYRSFGERGTLAESLTCALANQPAVFPLEATVACQGVEGAYQQIACDRMIRRAQISFFDSFETVFEAVEQGDCEFGVLPIENSTAGSVNHVFDLMMRHDFHIVRSCRLKIDHNLLVKPGIQKEDVRIIYSHQQAISQCADYIARIPNCRVHICENTAVASQMVARSERDDVAAIGSRDCAELYGLSIAESCVQDLANNYTRFACIAKDLIIYPGADRASFMAIVGHKPGDLYKVLGRFYALGINLIKLESRPIPGRDFEFMFYFDVECPAAAPEFTAMMDSLATACEEVRYLGSYSEVI